MIRYLLFVFILLLTATTNQAAETRGLRVVAKDPVTNDSAEVKLYNKTYAVIIGIDKYQSQSIRPLTNAVNDAQGVKMVLEKQYRFDRIIPLYNQEATKERILKLLTSELPREMGKDDALFLFWAGHGNQETTEYGDLGYLVPFDGSFDEIYKNITMTEIRDTISKKIPAKHVFYVMDACYGSSLLNNTRSLDAKPRRDLSYLKEMTKERVRQVLTAGGKNQEVLDGGPGGHSVFTGRLIEVLEAAGDFITANEIQAFIKEKVYGDAKARNLTQTPAFGTLYGIGDFVFVLSAEWRAEERQAEMDRVVKDIERSKKEQERLLKEQSELDSLANAARQNQDDRKRQQAELEMRQIGAKLKNEELHRLSLEVEQKKRAREDAEMSLLEQQRARQLDEVRKLEVQRRVDESRMAEEINRMEKDNLRRKHEEDQTLASLRKKIEAQRKQVGSVVAGSLSIEAAVDDLKNIKSQMSEIEREFAAELARQKKTIKKRLNEKLALLEQGQTQRMASLKQIHTASNEPSKKVTVAPKDEFETEAEYRGRVAKAEKDALERQDSRADALKQAEKDERKAYQQAVKQAETAYDEENREAEKRVSAEQQVIIKPLKERVQTLVNKEYTIPSSDLMLRLEAYDAERQNFSASVKSKNPHGVQIAMNGVIPLPASVARSFKQHYSSDLVRAEVKGKLDESGAVALAGGRIIDDADNSLMEYFDGEFISQAYKKWAEEEKKAGYRFSEKTVLDLRTGMMWARNGKIVRDGMNWNDAGNWVKGLNLAGYTDWRLPTKEELETLVKYGSGRPSNHLKYLGFTSVEADWYWTSTPNADITDSAVVINLRDGKVDYRYESYASGCVWPVRNGKSK